MILKISDALLDLANVVAHVINRAANMTQMLKNNVVGLSHSMRLSQALIIVNYADRGRPTGDRGKTVKKPKPRPAFKTEAEERKFRETHDSSDYVDWSKAGRVRFPNLKPSTTAISIRLPLGLLEQIKIAANKRDVPYQSLIKMWLAEKVG
ncbi:putative DNA binding CopG/RHH family protein [Bradyrhizobium sp. AZCC 2289]